MPGWSGCDVCLTGLEQTKGGFSIFADQVRHLKLPQDFAIGDIQKAQRDCEILGKILQSNSKDVHVILSYLLQNDIESAKKVCRQIGITEGDFVNQGGGLMWLVVIVVLLYAADAY